MERAGFLIEKLLDDYRNHATPGQLLVTLQLIQKELVMQNAPADADNGNRRISVILPGQVHDGLTDDPAELTLIYKPEVPETAPVMNEIPVAVTPEKPVPVITDERIKPDINEMMAENGVSLNDHLNVGETEMAETISGEPLKDLRKGIGVNDRFLFVNDLFRGDESSYERSIKTINGFNILPEAQYWIERELKIKLGWDDEQEVVKQFYALVRRRFS
jgi:hypothetical protein